MYGPREADEVYKKLIQLLFILKNNVANIAPMLYVRMNERNTEPLMIEFIQRKWISGIIRSLTDIDFFFFFMFGYIISLG